MYILIVSRGYPTRKYPRNGIFEYDQARALFSEGHKVVFASIDLRSIRRWRKWWYHNDVIDGILIESISLPCGRIPKPLKKAVSVFSLEHLYKNIVKIYGKPDVIHSHFLDIGEAVVKALKKYGVPLVHTEHWSQLNVEQVGAGVERTAEYVFCNTDGLIAVSESFKERLDKRFNADFTYVPNVVDTEIFRYTETRMLTESFQVISVGNLVPNKGMDALILAFSEAFAHKQGVHLYIVGEGFERGYLKRMANIFGISNRVHFLGSLKRDEIAKKMKECHCFALASRGETFGVAYIEAMTAGLPVIATKCGGPESFVDEMNGILVDVDDIGALTKALLYMHDNFQTFDKENISRRASEFYGPERVTEDLLKVYKVVIQKNTRRSVSSADETRFTGNTSLE